MKNKLQIEFKVQEHEAKINEILDLNRAEWNDVHVMCVESYLIGRKALLWVLSDNPTIEIDDYEKHARYECLCFDSTKIF